MPDFLFVSSKFEPSSNPRLRPRFFFYFCFAFFELKASVSISWLTTIFGCSFKLAET
jgi:hypothetical protein